MNTELVATFIDLNSKINLIKPSFIIKLDFYVQKIRVGAGFEIFGMIIACFLIDNKARPGFFGETFLLIDINKNIVLKISFFIFSNVKINFLDQKLN